MNESNRNISLNEDGSKTGDVDNDLGKAVTNESNCDVSFNEVEDNNGAVEDELGKTVTNESNRDGPLNDNINKTVAVGNGIEKTVTNEGNEDANNTGDVRKQLEQTVVKESICDASLKADTNKTGAVGNQFEKGVTYESNGDASIEEDTKHAGPVGNEFEKTVVNDSNGDTPLKEDTNKTAAVRKELQNTVTNENNSVVANELEKNITKEGNSDSSIEDNAKSVHVVGDELTREREIEVDNQVIKDKRGNDTGENCERSPIKEVTYDKDDKCNSESHAEEKVKYSDVDTSDDENLPLLELKMLSSKSQHIGQVDNTRFFISDSNSTLGGTISNGEGDGTNIDRIIERLQDNDDEDTDSFPMSMEEYRLTYAKEFFEAAIHDEQTIIKDTRKEVDFHVCSQSDTTLTPGDTEDSDCVKDSSDSEPEIIIYRNKKNKKKKGDSSRNELFSIGSKVWISTEKNTSRCIAREMFKSGLVWN